MNMAGVVNTDLTPKLWSVFSPMISKPLERTVAGKMYGLDDIYKAILDRDMQLWYIAEGDTVLCAAVTQIITYPKITVLDVLLVGGEGWDQWGVLGTEVMQDFARSQGCSSIRGYGRLGWARKIKHLNIEPSIYFDFPVSEAPHAN